MAPAEQTSPATEEWRREMDEGRPRLPDDEFGATYRLSRQEFDWVVNGYGAHFTLRLENGIVLRCSDVLRIVVRTACARYSYREIHRLSVGQVASVVNRSLRGFAKWGERQLIPGHVLSNPAQRLEGYDGFGGTMILHVGTHRPMLEALRLCIARPSTGQDAFLLPRVIGPTGPEIIGEPTTGCCHAARAWLENPAIQQATTVLRLSAGEAVHCGAQGARRG